MIAIGSVRLGISVAMTLRRKTKITSTTSTSATMSENFTSCTDCLDAHGAVVADRRRLTDGGSDGSISVERLPSPRRPPRPCSCPAGAARRARSRARRCTSSRSCCSGCRRSTRAEVAEVHGAPFLYRRRSCCRNCVGVAELAGGLHRERPVLAVQHARRQRDVVRCGSPCATCDHAQMPRAVSCAGSSCTRTAYFAEPNTLTCDTPSTIDSRCAIVVSATRRASVSGIVLDVSAKKRIGDAAGFCLRYDGGMMFDGRNASVAGDRRVHVLRRRVDVAVERELQRDVRVARARCST